MHSIARGSAASDVLVANAIVAGSATDFKNRASGNRASITIGSKTEIRNTSKAPYAVNNSFPSGSSTLIPMCPTVYAIAAPTPIGA